MSQTKEHWENVYATKQPCEVSWTQDVPQTSLDFILNCNLPKTAAIIDIGGGDSKLVDCLLEAGFENISVLDISEKALVRAQKRLGEKATAVKWIVADVTEFAPTEQYDVWHDRAAFHFLTLPEQKKQYLKTVEKAVSGYLILGTFSQNGPLKCSGLEIAQYSEDTLQSQFSESFDKVKCLTEDHVTPFNTKQNFLFCSFKKRR
jgi:2-polyprenyl-3-methyl-5-hydroxy-6-metoxy-1,4-benzoquinol methylase